MKWIRSGLGLWCLTPLSTIFQLYGAEVYNLITWKPIWTRCKTSVVKQVKLKCKTKRYILFVHVRKFKPKSAVNVHQRKRASFQIEKVIKQMDVQSSLYIKGTQGNLKTSSLWVTFYIQVKIWENEGALYRQWFVI